MIVGIVITALAIYVAHLFDYCNNVWVQAGWLGLTVLLGLLLTTHVVLIASASPEQDFIEIERIELAARYQFNKDYGTKQELKTLEKEVAEWNHKLKNLQKYNKNFFLDSYINDRIEDMQAIE